METAQGKHSCFLRKCPTSWACKCTISTATEYSSLYCTSSSISSINSQLPSGNCTVALWCPSKWRRIMRYYYTIIDVIWHNCQMTLALSIDIKIILISQLTFVIWHILCHSALERHLTLWCHWMIYCHLTQPVSFDAVMSFDALVSLDALLSFDTRCHLTLWCHLTYIMSFVWSCCAVIWRFVSYDNNDVIWHCDVIWRFTSYDAMVFSYYLTSWGN